jgi:hypothetical protein
MGIGVLGCSAPALAAYADFGKDASYIENLRRVGMTDLQAKDFLNIWKLVFQVNDSLTGVSATIFEHISDRQRCLAISRAQPQVLCPSLTRYSKSLYYSATYGS